MTTKCSEKNCKNKAIAGLNGGGKVGKLEFIIPLCQRHWEILGKINERGE